jgi:hypothetical protein
MKKVATIILNRNLPDVTDSLYELLAKHNSEMTDIYVVESGSDQNNLSKHCSYWANWDESIENGLRYPMGFNYGLLSLLNDKKYHDYEYLFLVCNDSVFEPKPIIRTLVEEMEKHPRLGILSPCSDSWGERRLLQLNETKYFWYINHISWLLRRSYVDTVRELTEPTIKNFLYDGSNFRGYESDLELIIKGYANDYASAVTTKVKIEENEDLIKRRFSSIKTDEYHINRQKVVEEGAKWIRRKYGFNSRWTMQMYAKFFYDKFFEFHPNLQSYKI